MTKEFPCPFCKAEFDTAWQLTNHVRISGGEHGPKYSLPEGFKVEVSEPNPPTGEKPNVSQIPETNVSKGPQDGDLTKVQKITLPITKPVLKCPECGSTKEDWVSVNAEDHGYNLTDEMKKEYDFICTNCNELIKVRE
ncbi:hypothetical protein KA005_29480 [bacterium]|nr:hypothetical protein [bacterium]